MASISSKVIFITTSPRTPAKMIPEIDLLNRHFAGQRWNPETQKAFMALLREENFFNGRGNNDPAFSARDRINRAPQTLGFVNLYPSISLTPAGERLIRAQRKEEVFLRQLLKFQLPSPYHVPTTEAAAFRIKPYLELFRLIRHFGSLKFDELMIFALQMTDYHQFDNIVAKIEKFRIDKAQNTESYRTFKANCLQQELRGIYQQDLAGGRTRTRESRDASPVKFLKTKAQNMRDYADACIRYLRATGMINISHVGRSLSIVDEKKEEVDYFLSTTDRDPCFVNNHDDYIAYLGDPDVPVLWTDNKDYLLDRIQKEFPNVGVDNSTPLQTLKEVLDNSLYVRQQQILYAEVDSIKDGKQYDDIQATFRQITNDELYDAPLMLEWNVWRAMTMIDGGNINANLKFDDFGKPMSTAQGNMADIECDYGDFGVIVEVTMASGQRQYETEGEPVSRHLAKQKKTTNKPTYCLFIAPTINEACIAQFYMLHKTNISFYGGISIIVPMEMKVFQKMLEVSFKASYVPDPTQVEAFFKLSKEIADTSSSEKAWYQSITQKALHWLN